LQLAWRNDDLFMPERSVKISRSEVFDILKISAELVADDGALRRRFEAEFPLGNPGEDVRGAHAMPTTPAV
jgi:hypothetical protein